MATADKPLDPKALEVKYTYAKAADDDKAINKVETAIALHFPAAYVSGLADKASDAPINKEEYEEQTKEAREKAAEEAKNNPKDVAKEAKESPPGRVDAGVAHHPSIVASKPTTGGPKEPQKGGPAGGALKVAPKAGKPSAPGPDAALSPPRELVLAAAMSGDGGLDKWLNDYPHKSSETNERLSKIKEMAAIAQGYDGQVEKYVQNSAGGMEAAKGGLINFLGKKDVGAIFGANPYDKVQGGLGSIMRGLSKFQSVVSIVGNVCGKIGMVLTIVGLIAMILPPLGAAVEAVARVLNVIGIICDAIGFVLSGILTGLNGVVLAKQIGKGASNEEKAATADMMMNEATSAGGHVLSLAMTYGPGFMKGFKSASKGVISKLFSGIKNKIGTFAAKTLGPVANWAKNIGFKLGIGLKNAEGPGMMSKLWKAPASLGEKLRGTKFITKINNSKFMQGIEARATSASQASWVKGLDPEHVGEQLGQRAATKVESLETKYISPGRTKQIEDFSSKSEKDLNTALEDNAAKNAGNRERAKIDRDISSSREYQNNQIADNRDEDGYVPKENRRNARSAGRHADKLEKGEEKAVANATDEGGKEFTKNRVEKKAEKDAEEALETKDKEEFRANPQDFQAKTDAIEAQREVVANTLKNKNITADQRRIAESEAKALRHEADQRHLIAVKANGGELPETLWHVKGRTLETIEAAQFKSASGERAEAANKQIESQQGGHAEAETLEKSEQRNAIYAWSWGDVPEIAVYEHVESMLEGVGEGADEHADEGDHDDEGHDDAHDANHDEPQHEPNMSVDPGPSSSDPGEPTSASGGDGGGSQAAPAPAPGPAPATKPAPAASESPEEKLAEVPELAYWPKLSGSDGEFAKAAKDLQRMKLVAYAFQKSQQKAKHKALQTVATMAEAGNDATLKQAQAMDHSIGINGTIAEAGAAAASAQKGDQHAGEGENKQNDSKANSDSKNQPKVDPGEKPSRWHPIKRIWWYVKKWASEKAAKVFGWIQDKIASLVLEGLCGVSMGDMRNYTTALHNRMQYSKLVGQGSADTAKATMDKAASVKTESKSYAEQALDDARECDQNVHDAATFVKDVEDTEKDLAKQQEMARTFLASLTVAVAAEKATKAKAQADAAAQQGQAVVAAPVAAAALPVANAAPAQSAGPKKAKRKSKPKEPKISAAAVGKVQSAASYVSSQANVVVQRLVESKTAQTQKLYSTFENKHSAKKVLAQLRTGDDIVASVQQHVAKMTAELSTINSMSPANAQVLSSSAGTVKSDAKELDLLAHSSNEQLNFAFKMTYDKVAQTRNLPWS